MIIKIYLLPDSFRSFFFHLFNLVVNIIIIIIILLTPLAGPLVKTHKPVGTLYWFA